MPTLGADTEEIAEMARQIAETLSAQVTAETVSARIVSDFITRAVMRELCLVAHDCGLVQISHLDLAKRLGASYWQIKRAISRLEADGYLIRAKRGSGASGNKTPTGETYKEKAPNTYLLAPLADEFGYELPTVEFLERAFYRYVRTARFNYLTKKAKAELIELIVSWQNLAGNSYKD